MYNIIFLISKEKKKFINRCTQTNNQRGESGCSACNNLVTLVLVQILIFMFLLGTMGKSCVHLGLWLTFRTYCAMPDKHQLPVKTFLFTQVETYCPCLCLETWWATLHVTGKPNDSPIHWTGLMDWSGWSWVELFFKDSFEVLKCFTVSSKMHLWFSVNTLIFQSPHLDTL